MNWVLLNHLFILVFYIFELLHHVIQLVQATQDLFHLWTYSKLGLRDLIVVVIYRLTTTACQQILRQGVWRILNKANTGAVAQTLALLVLRLILPHFVLEIVYFFAEGIILKHELFYFNSSEMLVERHLPHLGLLLISIACFKRIQPKFGAAVFVV